MEKRTEPPHPENRIGQLRRLRRKLAEQQTAANLREYLNRMGEAIFASSGDAEEEPQPSSN